MTKKKNSNKKIIIIVSVFALILLIGGFFLITKVFNSEEENNENISFEDESNQVIIGNQEREIIKTKSGREDFNIVMIFTPKNPQAWAGDNEGCKYSIQALNQPNYCINNGWDSIREDVSIGTSITTFDNVENGAGYDLITINVPEDVSPCVQRFTIDLKCNAYSEENVKDYFNLEVM